MADLVIENPNFALWSGSSNPQQHHYGKHGLLIHTTEVVELCLLNNKYFPLSKQAPPKLLYLAALYHDVGKIWDYVPTTPDYSEWGSALHKKKIHHVSRSAIFWAENASKIECVNEQEKDEVLHAILSHHQLREWGSPVRPLTPLAWLLHLCDNMSARLDDCSKIG